MSARVKRSLLTAVFIAGGGLYFANLKPAGLFYWDQAYYLVEAQTALTIFSKIPDIVRGKPIQTIKKEVHEKCGGIFPMGTAKPSYLAALTIFCGFAGFPDIATSLLSAFIGWMSVWLIFHVAKLINDELALWSGGLLLFSAAQLFFARNGTPAIMASFFFLAGFYFLLKERYFVSGLILGVAYSCHYALLPSLGVLALSCGATMIPLWRENRRVFLSQAGKWIGGLITVPVLWESVFLSIYFGLGPENLKDFYFQTYFSLIWRQFLFSGPVISGQEITWLPGMFPSYLVKTQGWPYLLILVIAVVYAAVRIFQKKADKFLILITGQAAVVLIIWMCKTGYLGGRIITFMIPFQCLLIASAICSFKSKMLKIAIFLAAVAPGLPTMATLLSYKSGYSEAAAFLKVGQEQVVAFENGPIWHFYLGQKKIFRTEKAQWEKRVFEGVKNQTVRYLVVDFMDVLSKETHKEEKIWVRHIYENNAPVHTIPNPLACDAIFQHDRYEQNDYRLFPDACSIRIYDLTRIDLGKPQHPPAFPARP